jgi:hypothetical protein
LTGRSARVFRLQVSQACGRPAPRGRGRLNDRLDARSLSDPKASRGEVAGSISRIKRWDTVLDDSNPPFHRFVPWCAMVSRAGCSARITL